MAVANQMRRDKGRHRQKRQRVTYKRNLVSRDISHAKAPANSGSNGATGYARSFNETFRKMASSAATAVGSKWAFLLSLVIVVVWAGTGPIFHFSDTWQLVINTGTTIVTFLMVFLIQNTQNRDAKAIHLKLDELIRGVKGARTNLVNLEELSDEELENLQREFHRVQSKAERRANHHVKEVHETAEQAQRAAVAATAEDRNLKTGH
jgi:low affinity Fe/Cu permease